MLERKKYLKTALPERDVDALKRWKQNELPLLAGVARSYLAIPVTSASSERMFSLGGRLVTDFRHNLNPENTGKATTARERRKRSIYHLRLQIFYYS